MSANIVRGIKRLSGSGQMKGNRNVGKTKPGAKTLGKSGDFTNDEGRNLLCPCNVKT